MREHAKPYKNIWDYAETVLLNLSLDYSAKL